MNRSQNNFVTGKRLLGAVVMGLGLAVMTACGSNAGAGGPVGSPAETSEEPTAASNTNSVETTPPALSNTVTVDAPTTTMNPGGMPTSSVNWTPSLYTPRYPQDECVAELSTLSAKDFNDEGFRRLLWPDYWFTSTSGDGNVASYIGMTPDGTQYLICQIDWSKV